jgi:hypothetical protein
MIIGSDLEGSGSDLFEVLSRNLSGRIGKNHKNFRIAGVPTEIRTKYFLNATLILLLDKHVRQYIIKILSRIFNWFIFII